MPAKVELEDECARFFDSLTAITSDQEIWSRLENASAHGNLDTVLDIAHLKGLAPPGRFASSALSAINHGHLDTVAALLDAGLPVDGSLVRAALASPQKHQLL